VDELGVYYRDVAGRPSCDPTLFRGAMLKSHGDRALLADGFDGLFVPAGFLTAGKAVLEAGSLVLPPDSSIELPPVPLPADGLSFELVLNAASERTALVQLAWAGSGLPFVDARLAAEAGILRLTLNGETVTALTTDGVRSWQIPKAPGEKAGLVLRATCPRDARSALVIEELTALRLKDKE
jgi:hypothetical protein